MRIGITILCVVIQFISFGNGLFEQEIKLAKSNAENYIIGYVGEEFFKAHVIFDSINSTVYTNRDFYYWTEVSEVDSVPKSFEFYYVLVLDDEHEIGRIRIWLKSDGIILMEDCTGLGRCTNSCSFDFTYKELKKVGKENGIRLSKKKSIIEMATVENGDEFIYELLIGKKIGEEIKKGKSCDYKYDVYKVVVINPWSKEIIRIEKMKYQTSVSYRVSNL